MFRARRVAVATAAAVAGVLAVASAPLSAHAKLVESVPRAFATVAESPDTIRLRFDEDVESALATMAIYDADQRLVQSPALGAADWFEYGDELVATPDTLASGTYVVVWRVVSADGHPVEGAFPFTVGDADDGADQQELLDAVVAGVTATSSLGVALGVARWLGYLGVVALLGVLVAVGSSSLIADRRVSGLWGGGALAVLTASLATLVLHGADAVRGEWTDVADLDLVSATLETRLGVSLVVRVAAVIVLVAAVARRQRAATQPASASWANLVAMSALVLAGTWAASGHASAVDPAPVAIAVHTIHLLAVGAWIGGLVTLLVAGDRADTSVVAAFSRRASLAVPAAVGAGVVLEWILVGDLSLIGDNAHSRALLVKVGLVAVVLVFAAAARAAFRGSRPAGVRRAMAAEAIVAAVVLAVTAAMVDFAPREQTRPDPVAVTVTAAGAVATVEVTSPETGPSQVHVYLTPGGGSLTRATSIDGRLRIPADVGAASSRTVPVDFAVSGSNHWTALVDFPYAGTWALEFAVTLPGPATVAFVAEFVVAD